MLASRRIDVGSVLKNTLPPERVEGVSFCGVHAWRTHVHIRRVTPDLTLHDRCPPNCCPPKLISSHTRWDFRPQVHTNTTGVSGLRFSALRVFVHTHSGHNAQTIGITASRERLPTLHLLEQRTCTGR